MDISKQEIHSPALGTPLAQGHDYHLQEKEGDVDVLGLHEGLPARLRFVHALRSGQVDLCIFLVVHVLVTPCVLDVVVR